MKVDYRVLPDHSGLLAIFEDGTILVKPREENWEDITPDKIKNQPVEDKKPHYELVQACRSLVGIMLEREPYGDGPRVDLQTNAGMAKAVEEAEKLWKETRDKAALYDQIKAESESDEEYKTWVIEAYDKKKKSRWWYGNSFGMYKSNAHEYADKSIAEEDAEDVDLPPGYNSIRVVEMNGE